MAVPRPLDHNVGDAIAAATLRLLAQRGLRWPFVLRSRPGRWKVAENLAWGTGSTSTPRSIVDRWMASPEHRANILGTWTYSAVWSQRDSPEPGQQPNSVICVQHFGRRT